MASSLPADNDASFETHFVGQAKRAPHWGVQSRFRVIYIYMCVCRGPKSVGGITWAKHAHAQSHYWVVKSDQCHPYYSFRLYARAALAWTEEKRSLEMRNIKQTELHRLKNRGKKG